MGIEIQVLPLGAAGGELACPSRSKLKKETCYFWTRSLVTYTKHSSLCIKQCFKDSVRLRSWLLSQAMGVETLSGSFFLFLDWEMEILYSTEECSLVALSCGQFAPSLSSAGGRDISLTRNKLILFEWLVWDDPFLIFYLVFKNITLLLEGQLL